MSRARQGQQKTHAVLQADQRMQVAQGGEAAGGRGEVLSEMLMRREVAACKA